MRSWNSGVNSLLASVRAEEGHFEHLPICGIVTFIVLYRLRLRTPFDDVNWLAVYIIRTNLTRRPTWDATPRLFQSVHAPRVHVAQTFDFWRGRCFAALRWLRRNAFFVLSFERTRRQRRPNHRQPTMRAPIKVRRQAVSYWTVKYSKTVNVKREVTRREWGKFNNFTITAKRKSQK